jgi:hypothetical protein
VVARAVAGREEAARVAPAALEEAEAPVPAGGPRGAVVETLAGAAPQVAEALGQAEQVPAEEGVEAGSIAESASVTSQFDRRPILSWNLGLTALGTHVDT